MNRSRITVMNATPSNIKIKPLSRRAFIDLAGKSLLALSGALGFSGLLRYWGYSTDVSTAVTYDLGPANNYPPGSRIFVSAAQAFILHTAQGYEALSAVCPHLGCSVAAADEGYHCPCHGSQFDFNGEKQQGPANQPLRHLAVEENANGHLTLLIT